MRRRVLIATGLAAVVTAGCGLTGGSGAADGGRGQGQGKGKERAPVVRMTMQQAAERADRILDDTFAAIVPPVQWTHRQSMDGECSTDRRRTVMTIVSEQRRPAFLRLVERHWRAQGFTFRATSKDKQAVYYLTPDGFQLSVLIGWKGQAHFEVTTPCVEKSVVRPPLTPPNGPDYSKRPPTAPNVESPFWSADTPVSYEPWG
ncbi:hypothetical protein ACF09L_25765 [Streptomyces sp. NPDC014779]|uniref:hypothetical protein n=1 Tax=unclassified Streptomyces TaxID=2593676 RepID=UPI0036FE2F50